MVIVDVYKNEKRWFNFFVRSNGYPLSENPDALVCFGLIPSIELGANLSVPYAVDQGLVKRSTEVQQLVASWTPLCRPIALSVDAEKPDAVPERANHAGPGLFYSGGVDSSYSLLMNQDLNRVLVSVIGCDVDLHEHEKIHSFRQMTTSIAEAFSQDLIFLETDLPRKMQRFLGWIEYHGSALAGLRHLLDQHITEMRIASSVDQTGAWEIPWGSHPGIDPFLGTDRNPIHLDGLVLRFEKIETISHHDLILSHLRICYHGGKNCGICSKCVYTRWCLRVLGNRDEPVRFGHPEMMPGPFHLIDDYLLRDAKLLFACANGNPQYSELCDSICKAIRSYERYKIPRHFLMQFKNLYRLLRHRYRFAKV